MKGKKVMENDLLHYHVLACPRCGFVIDRIECLRSNCRLYTEACGEILPVKKLCPNCKKFFSYMLLNT